MGAGHLLFWLKALFRRQPVRFCASCAQSWATQGERVPMLRSLRLSSIENRFSLFDPNLTGLRVLYLCRVVLLKTKLLELPESSYHSVQLLYFILSKWRSIFSVAPGWTLLGRPERRESWLCFLGERQVLLPEFWLLLFRRKSPLFDDTVLQNKVLEHDILKSPVLSYICIIMLRSTQLERWCLCMWNYQSAL